tara:strand:+ start:385 stop:720 length:336 start_codon:yes stop_codon:yes gene_type:complete
MSGKKYSFGTISKMKALEPGQKATIKFLAEPEIVETEYGEKYRIPISLFIHPSYPSLLNGEHLEIVWETKAQVIEKDLMPLLKESKEFQKDYLQHTWEIRVDDGGAYRLEG